MTFAELVVAVHDWMRRLPPGQVRKLIKRQLDSEEGVEGFRRGISVEAVLVMVQMGLGPGMRPVALRTDEPSETAITSESASKPEAEPEAMEAVAPTTAAPSPAVQVLFGARHCHGGEPGRSRRAAPDDWNAFVTGELQSLCEPCHKSTKRQIELYGYHTDVGLDGLPIDPDHPFNPPR